MLDSQIKEIEQSALAASADADIAVRLSEAMALDGRANPAFSIEWDSQCLALNVTLKPDRLPLFTRSAVEDFVSFLTRLDEELSAGAEVRWVVYRSAVEGVFSYGGDLAAIAPHLGTDSDEIRSYGKAAIDIIYRNWRLGVDHQVVTVALVAGHCLGGGLESALSCDLIFVCDDVQIGFPESTFGIFPGMGSYPLTEMRANARFARKLLVTGKPVDSAEAHAEGLSDFYVERTFGVAEDSGAKVPNETRAEAMDRFWASWVQVAAGSFSAHVARMRSIKASRPSLWKDLNENVDAMGDGIASANPDHGPRMLTASKMQRRKHKLEAV